MKRNIFNVPDIQDLCGNWLKSFYLNGDQHHTRSGVLWMSLISKTGGGNIHLLSKRSKYRSCSNGFADFQDFTNWCQSQFGYLEIDSDGRYWSLDKDILIPQNTLYSSSTCLFIPNRINQLLKPLRKVGNLPLGVCKRKYSYHSNIHKGELGQVYLGSFQCPNKAHAEWQKEKVAHIREICNNDPDVLRHASLRTALLIRATLIETDLLQNVETKL